MNELYVRDFFQNVINDIIFKTSGVISSITNNIATVNKTTNLQNGMYINIDTYKENFQITDVTKYSFKIVSTKNITIEAPTNYSLCFNFLFGNRKEIVNILTEKNQNAEMKFKKFPCLILFDTLQENSGEDEVAGKIFDNIFFAIVTETKPEFSTTQRIEQRFKAVLEPLFELFFNELLHCKYVYNLIKPERRMFNFTRENIFFWGSEGKEQNILNSFADAIEVRNLTLKFYKNY